MSSCGHNRNCLLLSRNPESSSSRHPGFLWGLVSPYHISLLCKHRLVGSWDVTGWAETSRLLSLEIFHGFRFQQAPVAISNIWRNKKTSFVAARQKPRSILDPSCRPGDPLPRVVSGIGVPDTLTRGGSVYCIQCPATQGTACLVVCCT